jgi:hypothetical protein
MIKVQIIIVSLFLGYLFTLNRSNQAEREANVTKMEMKAELHRSEHHARMERLSAEHEATMERFRLVDQLRALDAKHRQLP